ncbi:TPA: hypothetical protein ACIFDR_003743, partial [Acinetobacter baumannii]
MSLLLRTEKQIPWTFSTGKTINSASTIKGTPSFTATSLVCCNLTDWLSRDRAEVFAKSEAY